MRRRNGKLWSWNGMKLNNEINKRFLENWDLFNTLTRTRNVDFLWSNEFLPAVMSKRFLIIFSLWEFLSWRCDRRDRLKNQVNVAYVNVCNCFMIRMITLTTFETYCFPFCCPSTTFTRANQVAIRIHCKFILFWRVHKHQRVCARSCVSFIHIPSRRWGPIIWEIIRINSLIFANFLGGF